jgi:hypothetical protein
METGVAGDIVAASAARIALRPAESSAAAFKPNFRSTVIADTCGYMVHALASKPVRSRTARLGLGWGGDQLQLDDETNSEIADRYTVG